MGYQVTGGKATSSDKLSSCALLDFLSHGHMSRGNL